MANVDSLGFDEAEVGRQERELATHREQGPPLVIPNVVGISA
jgi:hypothetical protein